MILIVGLGNPGRKYKKTRHNVGFMVVDELIKSQKLKVKSQGILLIKPQTFMNQSGKAVKKIIQKSKVKSQNLIVIHDDIDLPFGTIRTSKNSSSAGHKGVQSIINELGTQNFTRVRIGIGQKSKVQSHAYRQAGQKLKVNTTDFVLKKFTKQEKKELKKIINQATEEIKKILVPSPASERLRFSHKSKKP